MRFSTTFFPLGFDPSDGGFDPYAFGVVFLALGYSAAVTKDAIVYGHPVRLLLNASAIVIEHLSSNF